MCIFLEPQRWVWNRFVNGVCFHVNGIKQSHWLAIQRIRQCHPCWKCFSKDLIHEPNIWTPTLASYSYGLIQISRKITKGRCAAVWSVYAWHLFLPLRISSFIWEVVSKESCFFLFPSSVTLWGKKMQHGLPARPQKHHPRQSLTEQHQTVRT